MGPLLDTSPASGAKVLCGNRRIRVRSRREVRDGECGAGLPSPQPSPASSKGSEGAVRESFRTLRPRSGAKPARAFSFLEVDGEDEQPAEDVSLIAMADRERK